MKKYAAVLLSVLLLFTTALVGVSAEEVTFAETSRRQIDADKVEITITMPAGGELVEVFIGGKACTVLGEGGDTITVLMDGVPTGLYTGINYAYTLNGQPQTYSKEGSPVISSGHIDVTLTASFNADGKLIVKAVDANDVPAREYQLKLTLEGMPEEGTTDNQGVYQSKFSVSEGKQATVEGVATAYREMPFWYAAVTKQTLTRQAATTTTVPTVGVTTTTTETEETTTTAEDTATTAEDTATTTVQEANATTASTASTTATVKGDSTTALANGMVAANALTDTALLETFGLTRSEFLSKARLLVSEADYTSLVGRTGNVPVLSVRTSTAAITPSMVQAALANVSEFSSYAEDQRQALTFDLSLLMFSRNGKDVPVTALPNGVLYTVQLPVPTAMKHCTAYAITVMDGDGLMTPQKLEVKNGMFELRINSLEAYTLIGFGDAEDNGAGGISWRLVVLLIAGILLIAGAGTLLYFFVWRKPDATVAVQEEQTELLSDTDTDIFSGRTDTENVWEPEDN